MRWRAQFLLTCGEVETDPQKTPTAELLQSGITRCQHALDIFDGDLDVRELLDSLVAAYTRHVGPGFGNRAKSSN